MSHEQLKCVLVDKGTVDEVDVVDIVKINHRRWFWESKKKFERVRDIREIVYYTMQKYTGTIFVQKLER